MQRRPAWAEVHPPVEEPQRGIEVEADADRRTVGHGGILDQVQVLGRVDHERNPLGQNWITGQRHERPSIRRRVADDDVLAAPGKEQRLRQSQREDAGKAIEIEHRRRDR